MLSVASKAAPKDDETVVQWELTMELQLGVLLASTLVVLKADLMALMKVDLRAVELGAGLVVMTVRRMVGTSVLR